MPLNSRLKELDAEKERLKAELADVAEEKPLLHPALAVLYRDQAAGLASALYDKQDGQRAFEQLRALIQEVRLTPVDGELTIELKGELAGILQIAQTSDQSPESAEKNALQIKMVAGAGIHRDRHLIKVLV